MMEVKVQDFFVKSLSLIIKINNENNINETIKSINLIGRIKYTSEIYDTTIIEIKENKNDIYNFLNLDINIMENDSEKTYTGNSIYILGYPKSEEIKVSYGILNRIKLKSVYEFNHFCCSDKGPLAHLYY